MPPHGERNERPQMTPREVVLREHHAKLEAAQRAKPRLEPQREQGPNEADAVASTVIGKWRPLG